MEESKNGGDDVGQVAATAAAAQQAQQAAAAMEAQQAATVAAARQAATTTGGGGSESIVSPVVAHAMASAAAAQVAAGNAGATASQPTAAPPSPPSTQPVAGASGASFRHILASMPQLSLGGGAGGGEDDEVQQQGEAIARLEQEFSNLYAKYQNLETAFIASRPAVGASGLGAIAPSELGAIVPAGLGSVGLGGAAREVEVREAKRKKAQFASESKFWAENWVVWSLRGKRGVSAANVEALQSVLGDTVKVTQKVFDAMKVFAGFDVLACRHVHDTGTAEDHAVADHFDLMCHAIMGLLKFGLSPDVVGDAASLRRLQPTEDAMLRARASFRVHVRKNHAHLGKPGMRQAVAAIPNEDLRCWSAELTKWGWTLQALGAPPASFDDIPSPPVPAFAAVHSFVQTGATLLSILVQGAGRGDSGGGGGAASGSGKRKVQSGGGGGKRRASERVCFAFRDSGSCKYGDECRFAHTTGKGAGGGRGGSGAGEVRAGMEETLAGGEERAVPPPL